jgi:hypothetical protein
MNHIELYEKQHGKEATKVYAFTLLQIQLIQGMSLLHSGDLDDDETVELLAKLSKLSSAQAQMYVKHLDLTEEEIQDAMEAASDYMHSETFGETIQ